MNLGLKIITKVPIILNRSAKSGPRKGKESLFFQRGADSTAALAFKTTECIFGAGPESKEVFNDSDAALFSRERLKRPDMLSTL